MKNIFHLFLLFSFLVKGQQPSPIAFTVHLASYSPSITCSNSFVPVVLQSDYTVSPVSYSWTNGTANFTGSLVNVTSPGIYTITAYANPTLVLLQTLTIPVNTVAPNSVLSPLSQTISCASSTAMVFASTTSSYSMHYFMSAPGGSFAVQGNTASYSPGMPGTYTHVVTDPLNGCSTQSTFTVTSNSAFPTFSLASAENFTLGCNTRSTAVVAILHNSVNPSGGTFSYTMTPSIAYTPGVLMTYSFSSATAGDYTVVVKDDVSQCESKLPITIIANTVVPYPYIYQGQGPITCKMPFLFSTLIHTQSGNYSYAWSVPFSYTAPVVFNHPYDTLTIFPDTAGNTGYFQSPWACVKDNNTECFIGLSTSIYMDILPPKVGIKTTRNYLTCKYPTTVITCSVQSTSQSWNPGPVTAYLWEGPSPQVSGTLSSGYLTQTPGIYTVHVVDWQSGCTNTDTIVIKDLRTYPQLTSSSQLYELCATDVTLQVVNTYTGPVEFEWREPGGAIANSINEELVANAPGTYTLIATDPTNECSVSRQFTVVICTGIEDIKNNTPLSVYPNPATNYIFVETKVDQTIRIADALSRVIVEQKIEHPLQCIDLSAFPGGVYFISLRENNQTLRCIKVIRKDSE